MVEKAKITTPIATAKASMFWIMTEPVSVPVTSAETSCWTTIKTTRPTVTPISALIMAYGSPKGRQPLN